MSPWIEILRPFTLLPPFFGIVSGGLAAIGSLYARDAGGLDDLAITHAVPVLLGGVMASLLNAASNVLNQVAEVDLDTRNKPTRVIPSGRMRPKVAWAYAIALYVLALALAWGIDPVPGQHAVFWCALVAAAATWLYSIEPFHWKCRGWIANATIAIPRGGLLKVAGWGCVASVADPEPWWIGLVFAVFLLGAASAKDLDDAVGDAACGCRTLVVRLGRDRAIATMRPFYIFPWMIIGIGPLIPTGADRTLLHLGIVPAVALSAVLMTLGWRVSRGLAVATASPALDGNHPAWASTYLLMMVAQVGLALIYLI